MGKPTKIIQDIKKLTPEKKSVVEGALSDPIKSMRTLTKGSLFMFMIYMWDTYSNDTFVPNWHIEELCTELEIVARRVSKGEKKEYDLIINIPPGTTKTATVSIFFPVWCWCNWYWMKFITSSHGSDLSLESAEYSRDIIRSDKFKMLFPDIDIKQDKDSKSNFRIIKKEYIHAGQLPRIKQGGGRVSTSTGAKIIGFHAHIIIPDDLIDPKGALSEKMLPSVNQYLTQSLLTRKTDKKVTTMIMIMQRLHQDDPTGYLLSKKKQNIRHICLPGELGQYADLVKPKKLKEKYIDGLLDPNRLGREELEEMEADLGQYGYAGQVGQNPTVPGGGMFKVDHLSVIEKLSSMTNVMQIIRYWDKAGTKGGTGAFTAGVKICKMSSNNKFYIMDVKRGRWSTEEREAIIRSTAEADGTNTMVYVEQEPGSGGKESAEATITNLAGFSIYRDLPKGDKALRADPFSVQVNRGNVIMLRAEWNKPFKDELEMFPNGKFKDQVDAASAAFNLLTAKKLVTLHSK